MGAPGRKSLTRAGLQRTLKSTQRTLKSTLRGGGERILRAARGAPCASSDRAGALVRRFSRRFSFPCNVLVTSSTIPFSDTTLRPLCSRRTCTPSPALTAATRALFPASLRVAVKRHRFAEACNVHILAVWGDCDLKRGATSAHARRVLRSKRAWSIESNRSGKLRPVLQRLEVRLRAAVAAGGVGAAVGLSDTKRVRVALLTLWVSGRSGCC
jgi:hypothetical protein